MKKYIILLLTILIVVTTGFQTGVAQTGQSTSKTNINKLRVDQTQLSITEERTIKVQVDFGKKVDLNKLQWTFGGKKLNAWRQWDDKAREYSGSSFISITKNPSYSGKSSVIEAEITFGLPYGTTDLSPRPIRVLYPELIGEYKLEVKDLQSKKVASTTLKLNVYDEFTKYEEIKPTINDVFAKAKKDRYLEYKSLGKSSEGRDIHFVILAKDENAVDNYLNETLPTALTNPGALLKKLENGTMGDYQVPIWFNNVHPDEIEGVDGQIELLKKLALEDEVLFKTTDEHGNERDVTLKLNEVLDHVIILFNFTSNPDGRVANERLNAEEFDLIRDNAYQTQVETIAVSQEVAKWTPLSFIELHGYYEEFIIEPATAPHNPNYEYDLLVDGLLGQAHAMGRAGIANSKFESYLIPQLDYENGWDDVTPSYPANSAMLQGSLGHVIEVPTLSQDTLYAIIHLGLGAIDFVAKQKDELFKQQLALFKRGIDGEDNREVDKWLVNAKGEEIGRNRGDYTNFFPDYYIIPKNRALQKNALEATNMIKYLLRHGLKVEETTTAVTFNGVTYPEGTYVVPMNQAKRGFIHAILYPGENLSDWEVTNDKNVVNFPALHGFDIVEVHQAKLFKDKTSTLTEIQKPKTIIQSNVDTYIISNTNNDAIKVVNDLLKDGKKVELVFKDAGKIQSGDYLVRTQDLRGYVNDYSLDVIPAESLLETAELKQPKVAVLGSPESKFVIKELGFPIVNVKEADIIFDDAGNATKEILSDKAYVGVGEGALYFVKEAGLLPGYDYLEGYNWYEALFQTNVERSLYTAGYGAKEPFYVSTGVWITSVPEDANVLIKIADSDYFITGFWPGFEEAQGKVLAFTTYYNDQPFTLFANDLTFRAHTRHSYRLLANSFFISSLKADLSVAKPVQIYEVLSICKTRLNNGRYS
ncbi:X-prolyl-dipeptidyl aminopeptidase [Sporosarcina sp. Te-1]|uniref:X-prolyl-dipeptidyl aminopeptidase n=1 Tax=Sporosarcina sp. Te-1 TaxID=2818390 RepID=UPI001A9D4F51|nr:X-prolyl-dipeptidyl aminopeptidase [Sporosarcina sp. Te-1]QTD40986.1 X-prolyl-dipeptidyl aminopeptidase [Sporosarcina sp. Te-1]